MIKGIIFDFKWTVYNPDSKEISEGLFERLPKLSKNYILYLIISDNEKEFINKLDIEKYFEHIEFISGSLGLSDLKKLVDKTKLNNDEIMVIGDKIDKEIVFGNKLGIVTARYNSGKYVLEEPKNEIEIAKYELPHFNQLPIILSVINQL